MKIISQLRCPICNFVQKVEVPADRCIIVYRCINCKTLLRPRKGDCCVLCSYANTPCFPKRKENPE